jgi:cytochrome c peroxidase
MGQSLEASAAKLQAMPKYVTLFNKAFKSKTITEENMLKALSQFERTLISGNSRFDRYMRGEFSVLTADELAGKKLFETHPGNQLINGRQVFVRGANCGDCHSGNLQTNTLFSNNALDATFADLGRGTITGQATDNGKFRVPSLRNIALTAPYMHDGRFTTLEEVVDHYNTGLVANSPNSDVLLVASNDPYDARSPLGLTATEKRQLVAFLKTLTDSTFIQDSRFAQPAQ